MPFRVKIFVWILQIYFRLGAKVFRIEGGQCFSILFGMAWAQALVDEQDPMVEMYALAFRMHARDCPDCSRHLERHTEFHHEHLN